MEFGLNHATHVSMHESDAFPIFFLVLKRVFFHWKIINGFGFLLESVAAVKYRKFGKVIPRCKMLVLFLSPRRKEGKRSVHEKCKMNQNE